MSNFDISGHGDASAVVTRLLSLVFGRPGDLPQCAGATHSGRMMPVTASRVSFL
jgi:hypothetical protein